MPTLPGRLIDRSGPPRRRVAARCLGKLTDWTGSDRTVRYGFLVSSADELREIALSEFAAAGYAGTSINSIARLAGLSKSAVLYHFASKESLLEAAIRPSIDRLERMFLVLEAAPLTPQSGRAFLAAFTDFILDHRLEVHLFINQGPSLGEVPVVGRANALVERLSEYFASNTSSVEEKMRFGIALGGAAYMLCSQHSLEFENVPREEKRSTLISILGALLEPATVIAPASASTPGI